MALVVQFEITEFVVDGLSRLRLCRPTLNNTCVMPLRARRLTVNVPDAEFHTRMVSSRLRQRFHEFFRLRSSYERREKRVYCLGEFAGIVGHAVGFLLWSCGQL